MRNLLRNASFDSSPIHHALQSFLNAAPRPLHIATFAPLPSEVNLMPLLTLCPDHAWYFPKVSNLDLTFHRVTDPASDLSPGAFQILEPHSSLPYLSPHQFDLFLCPGLAFDPAFHRLGKGLGFYDRFLSLSSPHSTKIGVAFPCQIIPDTFPQPHDIPMSFVCTGTPIPLNLLPIQPTGDRP